MEYLYTHRRLMVDYKWDGDVGLGDVELGDMELGDVRLRDVELRNSKTWRLITTLLFKLLYIATPLHRLDYEVSLLTFSFRSWRFRSQSTSTTRAP